MKNKGLLLLFLTISVFAFGQTEISKKENRVKADGIGKRIYIKNKHGKKHPKGDYFLKRKGEIYYFSTLSSGEIDGDSYTKKDGITRVKLKVKNGILIEVKKFNKTGDFLKEEHFLEGKTTVIRNYNKEHQLIGEIKEQQGKTIYEYNCYNYDNKKCFKEYKIKGIKEYLENGKVLIRKKTKNLAEGIASITDFFDPKDKDKRTIIYTNGTEKTIKKDGSYIILEKGESGVIEKKYDKKGNLINTDSIEEIVYPIGN